MRKAKEFLIYALGVQVLSVGMVFMVRSQLGVSIGTAVSFVLSERLTFFTLGVWNYICHGAVMVLLMVWLKRVRLRYLLSFLTSIFLGYSIDLYNYLLVFEVQALWLRGGLLAAGILCVALGIALTYLTTFAPAPFDLFNKEIAEHKKTTVARTKTVFDLVCLTTAVGLSLIFFGQIKGVHVGTVACALTLGTCIGFFRKTFAAPVARFLS